MSAKTEKYSSTLTQVPEMTGYQTAKYVVRLAEPELVVEAEVEPPHLPV